MPKLANNLRVAFMGQHGSQTYLASAQCYPDAELVTYPSFTKIAIAVANREIDFGMLAVESIAAGRVDQVHNILGSMDIVIVGEYFHPVSHSLMGIEASNLDTIKTVISHPQALMQCATMIEKHSWETQYAADSASAALQVSMSGDASQAAICAQLAGTGLGLKMLARNIQDKLANATLFVIVAHKSVEHKSGRLKSVGQKNATLKAGDIEGNYSAPITPMMSTLLVTLNNETASLHKALGCFANNGIDVIKLESYIPGGPSCTAEILLSVKGNLKEVQLSLALGELKAQGFKYKSLGTYPSAPERNMEIGEFTSHLISNGC